jgi:hypothetical protein
MDVIELRNFFQSFDKVLKLERRKMFTKLKYKYVEYATSNTVKLKSEIKTSKVLKLYLEFDVENQW